MFDATITETAARIRDGALGARDLTERLLARIAQLDATLHAHATVTAELALASAAEIDRARARGQPLGALAGVPLGLKDIIAADGAPTHVGSRALRNWRP
ncbi:MAG: amidase family protein, partial [Gammaproteobacteria bacterium]